MRLLGAVLAGGRSSRFGSDKALALLDGRPLVEHAVAALALHGVAVVIAGGAVAGLETVTDRPAPGLGPLGGLAGALHHAAANGFDAVLLCPCDSPRLDPALLAALAAGGVAAMVGTLPVCGLWPAVLAGRLDAHLATTADRSMRGWAAVVGARVLDGGAIANVNTPADLAALETGAVSLYPALNVRQIEEGS